MQAIQTDSRILSLNCQDRCSLSLLAMLLLTYPKEEVLFLSSQNYLLVKSEMVQLKMALPHFVPLSKRIKFFFVKSPFRKSRIQIFSSLERILESFEGTFIYFDRIDYYLDCDERDEVKAFFQNVEELVHRYQKRVLFVYGAYGESMQILQELLHTYTQPLKLRPIFSQEERHMTPTETIENPQEFADETLVELSLFPSQLQRHKPIQMMLISDNEEVKKLNYYLFREVEDIEYYTVDDIEASDMRLLEEMDILIFNKEDAELKSAILAYIREHHLHLKFFYITHRSYIRQKDLLKEHMLGVDKVLKLDFLLEDYILSMEKYLHSRFYSQRVLALESEEKVLYDDKERFESKIEHLLSGKIFFSLLHYRYDAEIEISEYNLKKIVREFDTIFIDKKNRTITFCILNVLPQFASSIIQKRINNFSITLQETGRQSAFDILFEKES